MCEDLSHRRVNLNSILEACESQLKASILLPPAKVIRQLVEEVFHESVSRKKKTFYTKVMSDGILCSHQPILCVKLMPYCALMKKNESVCE